MINENITKIQVLLQSIARGFILICLSVFLIACGQMGPLYLPKDGVKRNQNSTFLVSNGDQRTSQSNAGIPIKAEL